MQVSGRALGSSGCSCSTIPHQFGRQILTFQNRSQLQSKRAVAQRVVAASTPVATVEKKLKKTASKIADTAKDVAEKVTSSAKPDLSKVVLLQGENVPSFPSDPRAMPDPIRALQHTRHISAQFLLFNVCCDLMFAAKRTILQRHSQYGWTLFGFVLMGLKVYGVGG